METIMALVTNGEVNITIESADMYRIDRLQLFRQQRRTHHKVQMFPHPKRQTAALQAPFKEG